MIKNVVFAGGGFKGWAYVGTLKALKEYIPIENIEQVIGVSIGSLFGIFYVLQMDPDFLLDFIMNLNFKEIIDINLDSILVNQSILQGDTFTGLLRELLSFKVDPDITFRELKRYTNILFSVNALNISDSKLEYFNSILTPDVKVIDAVRASCSIPFLLPSYCINNKYYFDGGIINNCPVDMLDELSTIAFDISHDSPITSIKLYDFLNSVITIANRLHAVKNQENVCKILDDRFKDEMFNLNQSKDDIFNIYMNGYINSKNIIFNNYVAIRGPPVPD
jgi:predicted acylesterase/phospholipase RssA